MAEDVLEMREWREKPETNERTRDADTYLDAQKVEALADVLEVHAGDNVFLQDAVGFFRACGDHILEADRALVRILGLAITSNTPQRNWLAMR
jgi:hypothetical protein